MALVLDDTCRDGRHLELLPDNNLALVDEIMRFAC
jgi:hypothetical protein